MTTTIEKHQVASVERLSFIEEVLADALANWERNPSDANGAALRAARRIAEEVLAQWEEWNLD